MARNGIPAAGWRRILGGCVVALIGAALVISLAGCAAKPPKPTFSASDPAGKAACFKVQQDFESAVIQYELDHPNFRPPLTPAGWAQRTDIKMPYCPAGGQLAWDPTTQEIECSIHGRYTK